MLRLRTLPGSAAAPALANERPRIALQGLTAEQLVLELPEVLLAEARRIVAVVQRGDDFRAPRSGVRRSARQALCERGHVPSLVVASRVQSDYDAFLKLVLRTEDGRSIEAVRIPLEHPGRFSVCVSSQVGCALACTFCATGRLGLGRNLETWEIVEQVRCMRSTLDAARGQRVHGVVFQGMGEPLSNLERVIAAVRVLSGSGALGIDQRKITISTAGLPAGIRRLARELPKVRLAWSIGSALPGARERLMPIDRAHPLEETYRACVEHAQMTRLAPLWAVTLLAGVNDSEADARALAALAQRFAQDIGRRPRISIIPYNRIDEDSADPFRRASDAAEQRFREWLSDAGTYTHRRYSGGADVGAACGQLAATS
jgi:23S rRNA (adenine2503-C2)-methyltransferase